MMWFWIGVLAVLAVIGVTAYLYDRRQRAAYGSRKLWRAAAAGGDRRRSVYGSGTLGASGFPASGGSIGNSDGGGGGVGGDGGGGASGG